MNTHLARLVAWFSNHWNKRRTSAIEKRLKKQNNSQAAEIARLEQLNAQLTSTLDEERASHELALERNKGRIEVLELQLEDVIDAHQSQMKRRRIETDLLEGRK